LQGGIYLTDFASPFNATKIIPINPTPAVNFPVPNYRRACQPGGTFFLTLVTERRVPFRTTDLARPILHDAIATAAIDRSFELVTCVLLPDHLHLVMMLPTGDSNFSTRVAAIKARFTRAYLATVGGAETAQSMSRDRQGYRGVWQKRFWEHTVRDRDDLIGCLDYVHYNPRQARPCSLPARVAMVHLHPPPHGRPLFPQLALHLRIRPGPTPTS
jgi:putative transposase